VNHRCAPIDFAGIAAAQVEAWERSVFEGHPLTDRTVSQRERERDCYVRQVELARDSRAEQPDALRID
jgi:hypothetical protein